MPKQDDYPRRKVIVEGIYEVSALGATITIHQEVRPGCFSTVTIETDRHIICVKCLLADVEIKNKESDDNHLQPRLV